MYNFLQTAGLAKIMPGFYRSTKFATGTSIVIAHGRGGQTETQMIRAIASFVEQFNRFVEQFNLCFGGDPLFS